MDKRAAVAVMQYMGYDTKINDETELYLRFCDESSRDCQNPFQIYIKVQDLLELRRIFSGGIPPESSDQITEAEFMIHWFEKRKVFDPNVDFRDDKSKNTRENVLNAIPIIKAIIIEEIWKDKIVSINICCDQLRAPRIQWLYWKYGGMNVRIYAFPFQRTNWEIFREFISFHVFEKANFYLPGIVKPLEPIRRWSRFRKSR